MKKQDKANLIAAAFIIGVQLLILGVIYFVWFYEPVPPRYYFIDMYKEQQAERERAASN